MSGFYGIEMNKKPLSNRGFLMHHFLELLFSDERIDEFFNHVAVIFVHVFNGLELIDQFGIGKFGLSFFV